MADDWERINEALGAELQGRSLAPHVSRQTLFGIKSNVESQMEAIAADVARGGEATARADGARGKLEAIAGALGDRLEIGRADRYYIHRARGAGYDIPAYPFSRAGDLASFLEDEGADDLPSWYARIGVGPGAYRNLAAYALVVLRDGEGRARERLVAHAAPFVDETRFLPLEEDVLLEKAPPKVIDDVLSAVRSLLNQQTAQK